MPAAAIAGSNEYLRAVCGMKPPGGRYLHLYAADVGRGPDGRWWVLSDRTQAPSGAGYALENRLVLSRAFSNLYKSMNVERVAPFFEAFRDSLRASADRDEPRIGLLTPGAFNETYFEHATIARYLGFLLVEGDDLAVSGDRIHIRTVAGLKRLDVLLRRVDSNFLDPLELDASSHLGVPGLIDVLRKNGVVVANMPGSGVLEARALLGFLPNLSRRLLGEDLKMPHIATWWCGQKSAREEVLSRLDDFAIEGAYGRGRAGLSGQRTGAGQANCRRPSASGSGARSPSAASTLSARNWCGCRPRRSGRTAGSRRARSCCGCSPPPRPMAGPSCPAASAGSPSSPMPARYRWATARGRPTSGWSPTRRSRPRRCCRRSETVRIKRIAGVVPSRAADNLFWLGRYLERAEATLRLIRALGTSVRDPGKGTSTAAAGASTALHSVERIQRLLVTWGADLAGEPDQFGQGRRRGAAEPGKIRLGAVAAAIGAAHRDLAAGTAVARRLAGHHRDGGASRRGGR